jgi:hypothetical protein
LKARRSIACHQDEGRHRGRERLGNGCCRAIRKADIKEDHIRPALSQQPEGSGNRARRTQDHAAEIAQNALQLERNDEVILDDKDLGPAEARIVWLARMARSVSGHLHP